MSSDGRNTEHLLSHKMPNPLNLLLVGDVNLRNVNDPCDLFSEMQETFDEADVRFANCEGCYSDPTVELPYKQGWFHPSSTCVDGLSVAGFDAVGCANNVTFGAEAILESLGHLDRLGIAHTGAGRDPAEARGPAIVERDGTRFGFLAYTSVFWPAGHAAKPGQPGVATIKAHSAYRPHRRALEMPGAPPDVITWPSKKELDAAQADIESLRSSVDVVVMSFHWEISGRSETVTYQHDIAHAAIDAGADIVIGHHPHVIQGVEIYAGKPIFYSLGNFVFGWEKMAHRHPDGLLVLATIASGMVSEVSLHPVCRDERGQPRLPSIDSPEWRRVADTVASLSSPWETQFRKQNDALVVVGK